jgi:hypothetical protein
MQIVALSIAALVLATALGLVVYRTIQQTAPKTVTLEQTGVQISVPAEALSFVETYKNRYEDPVSAYYSEKAYEAANGGKSLILTDDFVASYEPNKEEFNGSVLGFERFPYNYPSSTKMDPELFMSIYNSYISKEMSLYMNALAKNPTAEGTGIVDRQFQAYCSYHTDAAGDYTFDDEYIASLMTTLKRVVTKHGSAANYAATNGTSDQSAGTTLFNPNDTVVIGGDEAATSVQYTFNYDLVIRVEEFSDKLSTVAWERFKQVNQTIIVRPDGFLSIGELPIDNQ